MLRELVDKGLTDEQVAKARSEVVSRHLLGQQTAGGQAASLAHYEALGVGWKRLDELPALVEKTSAAQVNEAIKKHLHPDKLVIAVVGDLKKAGIKGKE
jgi:predicted Zn-dependent peptidase